RLEIQKEFLGKHGMGPFCLALGPNACALDQLPDASHSSQKVTAGWTSAEGREALPAHLDQISLASVAINQAKNRRHDRLHCVLSRSHGFLQRQTAFCYRAVLVTASMASLLMASTGVLAKAGI